MFSLREKTIAFYLSFIIPVELCLLVVGAMKVGELEDAKEEHMVDCSYFRSLTNISGFGPHLLRMIAEKNYISRLYKHVDADEKSDRIPEKILRLSRGFPMYHLAYDNADIQRYPDSLLNEGNPTLAENTVSQALLNRIRKDNYLFINESDNYGGCGKTHLIINIIKIINKKIYADELDEIKKKKKLQRKITNNHNPPLVQKGFMNKSFRNKCR
tara:strand:+ start:2482 stop:3123 length:642 start_codon:yes stop_codon:yes gene_type:complete